MPTLSPSQAALIARGVYRLRTDDVSTLRDRGQSLGCEGLFRVDDGSRFQGRSGGLAWKALSGFGYIANGEGQWQGDVLLVTRGTAMGLDWLSNLNIGMQIGPGGHPVHAGFHEVWKSFAGDVGNFMRNRNAGTIHCVGHSLGGALAALNADHLSSVGAGQIKLYTFGSPRAGTFTFSISLTRRISAQNIHRVSHGSDPVPMIPLFPFQHLPSTTEGIRISSADAGLVSVGAHSMEGSYIPGVEGSSWDSLQRAGREGTGESQIMSNLAQASGNNGFVMGSAKLLSMIGKALRWVLERAKDALLGALGTALAIGATVLDQLAWLLSRAASLSGELADKVKTLMGAIFRFLGRTLKAGTTITAAFLRWALDLLFSSLRGVAERALTSIS